LDVLCPRCRAHIHPGEDRCPTCGLTVEQLEHLIHSGPTRTASTDSKGRAAPGYYTRPTYGRGPALRGTGPAPPSPRIIDVNREDAIINLTDDGDAEVVLTQSGASVRLPPAPSAPAASAVVHKGGRRVELILLIAVVLVACTIVAALLRLSS
jgi:hypothetical protein